nr:retrotransposon protein [Tanacetum cinerariifolium]
MDDEAVQYQRQRDDNNLQDERQDQPKEEEVEPRRSKKARTRNRLDPIFFFYGYKWIFKKKMKADGTINKYKARLMIKGFRQREDYDLGSFGAFPSYEAKHRLEINFHVDRNFRNNDWETGSQSDNTVGSLHGFIIHGIEVFEDNKEVTKVIDVENWWIDNYQILRWVVSLIIWNFFVLSMKSSIQSTFRNDEIKIVILQGPICTVFNFKWIDRNLKISRKPIEETEIFISQSLDDMITGRKEGSSKYTYSKLSGRGLSSRSIGVIAMNLSNSEKISSLRRVPSMERRILLPSSRRAVDIKDHSFSPNSKIELFLFNSSYCISSVKKGLSQDKRNFDIFFHFEDNEIDRKDYDHGSFEAFPSYEAKHRLEIHFHVERKHGFLQGVGRKELGERIDSEEFMNVFVRISFGSAIKLVSFNKGQVVTFNGKFICSFRNSDCKTESQSDNMVGSLHGFIIHGIEVFEGNEEVTELIDVENWRIDNSQILRWVVSLIVWNFSVLLMKSLIQSTFRFGYWFNKFRTGSTCSLLSPAVQLTVLAVVPWETDGKSVLREACQTRASTL